MGVRYPESSHGKTTDGDQFVQAAGQLKTIFDSRDPTFIQTVVTNLNTFGRAIEKNQELSNKINSLEKKNGCIRSGGTKGG